jgi:predicted acyltransferase
VTTEARIPRDNPSPHGSVEVRDTGREGNGPIARAGRLRSLDALRGLAIVVMLLSGNPFMRDDLPVQFKHPQWHGLRFADLFFPLFLFVVGIAMTLSRRTGSPRLVLKRVALLALLGVALTSFKHRELVLPGVLQHIAISYLLAWLVLQTPRRLQPILTGGILLGIWAGFLLWAGEGQDPWGEQDGFAHAVNEWILGGFATEGVLQSVASTVTVLGGALIGRAVVEHRDPRRLLRIVGFHALWLTAVALFVALEVPISKRIWSPSFTLITLATSCWWFALLIWLIDIRHHRWWVAPLHELGANPIAVYVGFIAIRAVAAGYRTSAPHLAPLGSELAGAMTYAIGWVALGWLFAHLLYRRGIFLRL